jgi:glucosamine--fructose-6-phosphate aminotransferase (isomerizing)
MCGIVGYIGRKRSAMDVLIDGLRRLEYRGYDSAGVAIIDEGSILVRRALGKLANLEGVLRDNPVTGHVGIGHTRWATHGKPSERNAHPHCAGSISLIHNGIVENYRQLRAELEGAGRTMESDTDTELIAHLIDQRIRAGDDLLAATRSACSRISGSYALAVVSRGSPDHIVAAKTAEVRSSSAAARKRCFSLAIFPRSFPTRGR